jgi:hypothetical protein
LLPIAVQYAAEGKLLGRKVLQRDRDGLQFMCFQILTPHQVTIDVWNFSSVLYIDEELLQPNITPASEFRVSFWKHWILKLAVSQSA